MTVTLISTRCRHLLVVGALCMPATRTSSAAHSTTPGEEFQVNTQTDGIQQSSAVAMDARGDFVVTWQSEVAGGGDEIRARRFDSSGVAKGGEIAVNAVTQANQNAPAAAMDADGDFVVVWQSLVANHYEIRARRFDARGVAQGGDIAVNTTTGNEHSAPAVAMAADGNFVVAWESSVGGSYEIRARRFDSQGTARGGEVAVNTLTSSSQRAPAVAMDASGDFVVAWTSNVDRSFEIRAQRFTAGGAPRGSEIAVNAQTAGDQLAPSVAVGAEGAFVVAWENAFEQSFAIRVRRFTASGVATAEESAVNPATAGRQFAPSVAMDGDGNFVVAWHERVADGYDVRARRFAANSAAQGAEVAVNTVTRGTQKAAAVAMDTDGTYVVSWHGDSTGSWEVAARRSQPGCSGDSKRGHRSAAPPMPSGPL